MAKPLTPAAGADSGPGGGAASAASRVPGRATDALVRPPPGRTHHAGVPRVFLDVPLFSCEDL
ncbi:hypothetical protein FAGKG844_290057 [Frankia sp. AgKG'84/4]